MTQADQDRKAPGRPRNAQADTAIIEAVLALLNGGMSADALSIEAVAAKAGVGKATIYRRWANKSALLVDAIAAMKGPIPVPDGVSVRDDLVMLVSGMGTKRADNFSRVTMCLLPELAKSHEMLQLYRGVSEPRRDVMRGVLRRGIAEGTLRADLDLEMTVLMLTGPTLAQKFMHWDEPVDPARFAETLVDSVLRGVAA